MDFQGAVLAARLARAAPILSDVDQKSVELTVKFGLARQRIFESGAQGFVIGLGGGCLWQKTVPAENPMGIGVHNEDRVLACVEQNRIGGIGAYAPYVQQLCSRSSCVGVRNIRAKEAPCSVRRKRTKAFSFLAF